MKRYLFGYLGTWLAIYLARKCVARLGNNMESHMATRRICPRIHLVVGHLAEMNATCVLDRVHKMATTESMFLHG